MTALNAFLKAGRFKKRVKTIKKIVQFKILKRAIVHLDTKTWQLWGQVSAIANLARVFEVFMKMINILDYSITDISGYLDIVDHRHVLHILAQTDATCVRADQLAVLCREHVDGQNLVETT